MHFHSLLFDGVYEVLSDSRGVRFRPLTPPDEQEVLRVLADTTRCFVAALGRIGYGESEGEDELARDNPVLAALYAAEVQGRAAMGEDAGRRIAPSRSCDCENGQPVSAAAECRLPKTLRSMGENLLSGGTERASGYAEVCRMNQFRTLLSFLAVAVLTLSAQSSAAMCGDVTGDGKISSGDALTVLREAVGVHQTMMCDMCGPYDSTTTTLEEGATTTTVPGSGSFRLHVTVNGMMSGGMMDDGNGQVTSDPAGISCGQDCSEDFDAGQAVTLTATAAADSDFVGWMGDVPVQCMYNDDPCTVTMKRDRDVWAVFLDNSGGGMGGGGMHP